MNYKNLILFLLLLITFSFSASAVLIPSSPGIDGKGVRDIWGFDEVNATTFYQNGNAVLDTSSSIPGSNSSFNQTLTDSLYAPLNYGDDWNKTYADTLYIAQSDEANLNVNSSYYWDDLNSPSDIGTDDLTDDGTWILSSDESSLNVNSSNSTTFWYGVSSFISRWFYSAANVLNFNETRMNSTIATKILSNNNSVVSYIDSQNTLYNDSIKNYTDNTFLKLDTSNDPLTGKLNLSVGFDSGEIDWDGTNMNGTINYTDGILRINDDASLVVYDTDGEAHLVDADLTRFDELRANTFTTPLNITTFNNATGTYVNVSTDNGDRIAVVISNGTSSFSTRFPYSSRVLELTTGTNSTPVLNKVYIKAVGGILTWFASTSDPVGQHAMIARINVGANGYIYSASLQEDGSNGVLKRIQRTNRKRGLLYEDGMNYTATSTDLIIDAGNYINGIYDSSTKIVSLGVNGFYLIRSDGTYNTYSDFSDITEYADGNSIGSNKYVNIVFGIIPYDGTSRIYAVIQNKPPTEYTSTVSAYADSRNTVNIYPSNDFERIMFLPVARMIINSNTNLAQILPNGYYAEDYRGGVAGGVSSGGGLSEADPLSVHFDGSVSLTADWDAGSYQITTNEFAGKSNWSYLQNYPTSCPSGTFVTTNGDSNTCTAPTASDVDPGTYPTGNYIYNGNVTASLFNGALDCSNITGATSDLCTITAGSSGNIFDQTLNTTDNVEFVNVNVTGLIYGNASQMVGLPSGGDLWSDPVDSDIIPDGDNTRDLGASGTEFKDLYIDGTANIDLGVIGVVRTASLQLTDNTNIRLNPSSSGWVMDAEDGDTITINSAGRNVDTIIEGDTDINLFYADAGLDKICIGCSTPTQKLHVVGNVNVTQNVSIGQGKIYHNGSGLVLVG